MRITNKSLFQGLKDMVFLVIMFNTCITQIIVRKKELTKKLTFQKTVLFFNVSEAAKYGSKFSTNAYVLKNSLGLSETKIDEAKSVIRNVSEKGLVRGFYISVLLAKLQSLG